jgi:hypothetical protein
MIDGLTADTVASEPLAKKKKEQLKKDAR